MSLPPFAASGGQLESEIAHKAKSHHAQLAFCPVMQFFERCYFGPSFFSPESSITPWLAFQ